MLRKAKLRRWFMDVKWAFSLFVWILNWAGPQQGLVAHAGGLSDKEAMQAVYSDSESATVRRRREAERRGPPPREGPPIGAKFAARGGQPPPDPGIRRRRLGRRLLHGGEAREGGREEQPGVWQKGGWEEIRRLAGSPARLAAATCRTAALERSKS